MSVPSSRTPSYRLHKPTGQAVVTIGGRDFYLGRHGTPRSRAEYDRIVAEWLSNGRRVVATGARAGRTSSASADVTVSEVILSYVRHAESYYVKDGKPTKEFANIRLAMRPLRKLYGHTQAKDFGPLALKVVRETLIGADLCRTEVNRRVRHVVRMFRWATENEIVPPSVHHGLRAVAGLKKGRTEARESEPVRPVPDAFVDAVRPHVAKQVRAMIDLQRLTGMRPGEVCMMRSCDLDTSGRVWVYTPGSHKTQHHGKERTIYIGPRAQEVLRPWLRPGIGAYLFSPREAMEEHLSSRRAGRKTPITPSHESRRRVPRRKREPGDHYARESYSRAIAAGCKKAGVPHWHPNQLRHNAATALRKEFGLDVARVVLGHSSPVVTEVYAEMDAEKAVRAMAIVG